MGSGRVAELREYVRAWRWGLRARLIPAGPPHLPYPPRSALTLPLPLLLLLRLLPSQPQHTQKIPPLTTYRTVSPWVIPVVLPTTPVALYPHLVTLPTSLAPPPHTLPGCPHYWFLTRRSFNPCEGPSRKELRPLSRNAAAASPLISQPARVLISLQTPGLPWQYR